MYLNQNQNDDLLTTPTVHSKFISFRAWHNSFCLAELLAHRRYSIDTSCMNFFQLFLFVCYMHYNCEFTCLHRPLVREFPAVHLCIRRGCEVDVRLSTDSGPDSLL